MRDVRVSAGTRRSNEARATGVFVATLVVVAVLVPLIPHLNHTGYLHYTAVNGTVGMNWFFQRPHVRPNPGASMYGISTRAPIAASAGASLRIMARARPTGAPGGRVCVSLLAFPPESSAQAQSSAPAPAPAPTQTAHECAPLTAGWKRLPTVTLRTTAPSLVYAEITADGNAGGLETGPLNVTHVAR